MCIFCITQKYLYIYRPIGGGGGGGGFILSQVYYNTSYIYRTSKNDVDIRHEYNIIAAVGLGAAVGVR